ncbi:hypothetical protein ABFS82_13G169800 [Erythranthe guttata]|uniref:tRNA-uridine aminocarboxypropyltransferase n=1 Tax=Erythranthe guttata TaxID=4155 RepID=A0A022PYE1_ERYGU|nr:PREDICTED: uncharacterized protein LOC105948720 [Erythranthe guttata]EYU19250.1 hypothetical protein MIMGU_mgv1a008500mg [Erythranthe guttata]|eukprot:XP_012827403.1 PREDICTED: uncharacterized protein LOC105948720 [Erythranthe guttata]
MVTQSGSTKRPTCPSCCKPARICLCNRLQTPIIDNSVSVTILRHTLETKHPLNSTRIATIGLKNVDVITISDVNFQAQFFIRFPDSSVKLDEDSQVFDEMPSRENVEFAGTDDTLAEQIVERSQIGRNVAILSGKSNFNLEFESVCGETVRSEKGEVVGPKFHGKEELALSDSEVKAINFTVGKYGAVRSFQNHELPPEKCRETSFDDLFESDIGAVDIRRGFVVKKLQTKLLEESNEYKEIQEFEIAVPPGSVLLFPSERSIEAEAVDFEVKNLIVLDGTWAKARRMYNENPWLRLLPHIGLNVDKLSLYREVRNQPRAEYLSTIESIVYAMKAVGEDSEGLDGLLDVFESMVGDQRRCMNERLSKISEN